MDERAITFTRDELWYLQGVVRHEMSPSWQGSWPPVSVALNDQVAEALLRCERYGLEDASLSLSRGDCYVIDYTVRADAKDARGVPLGKAILLKSFAARFPELDLGPDASNDHEADQASRLKEWRDAESDDGPNDDARNDPGGVTLA